MAKMKPPIVPEQPVPVILEDGLRRLLKTCEGKDFEARRDTALIMLLLDTGACRDELMSRKLTDLDLELDVLLVVGKGRRERALPFAARARLRWTATYVSATGTRTPICPGCGWDYGAG
jgi:site-specific recombinase XerD